MSRSGRLVGLAAVLVVAVGGVVSGSAEVSAAPGPALQDAADGLNLVRTVDTALCDVTA
jgi:hypothetical protein